MGTQEQPRLSAWSRHPLPGTGQALPDRGRRRGRRGGARRVHTGWHTVCLGRHLRAPLVSRSALANLVLADRNEGNSLLRFPQRAVLPFCDLWSVGAEWEYAPPKPTHRLCDASTAGLSTKPPAQSFSLPVGSYLSFRLARSCCGLSVSTWSASHSWLSSKENSQTKISVIHSDWEWFRVVSFCSLSGQDFAKAQFNDSEGSTFNTEDCVNLEKFLCPKKLEIVLK